MQSLAAVLLLLTCTLTAGARLRSLQLDETYLQQARYVEHTQPGSVILAPDGQFEFVPHAHAADAVAWGSYLDGSHTVSNFGQLRVTTSGDYTDADQVFAAGWLEGYLSAPRIFQNFQNLHTYFIKTLNASLEEPMEWMQEQDAWVRKQCERKRGFQMPPGQASSVKTTEDGEAENFFDKDSAVEGEEREYDYSSANSETEVDSFHKSVDDAVLHHHGHYKHKHHKHHHHHQGRDSGGGSEEGDLKSRFWDATCLAIRQFDGIVAGYQARAAESSRIHPNSGNGNKNDHENISTSKSQTMGTMSYSDFLFMESNGDLYDVIDKLDPSQRPSWSPGGETSASTTQSVNQGESSPPSPSPPPSAEKLFHDLALSGKCSALVKIAADLSDIYMGHSTWDSYTAMLRIYKHYSFNLTQLKPAAQRSSFSSYPGEVFSDDDFFILSSKMVVLQTTNKIFNDELFDSLRPHSVLSWQRIRAANWLATSGEEWAKILEIENSGTYNNQYMVIDLTKFIPGEDPHPGLLWVAEQIPGKVVAADMTSILSLGYWPSFNVPAFPEIYNASGYPDFITKLEKYGQKYTRSTHWLSYESSPRAAIFRRDQAAVDSLEGMKAIMRSNNWKNDPLSEGHPICAVCGRGDLDTTFPEARGCYDTKVTSWRMALEMEAEAVNGPTTGGGVLSSNGGDSSRKTLHSWLGSFISERMALFGFPSNSELPEFNWEKAQRAVGQELLHQGQPERFNFKFERQGPGSIDSGMVEETESSDVVARCSGNSKSRTEVDSVVLASV